MEQRDMQLRVAFRTTTVKNTASVFSSVMPMESESGVEDDEFVKKYEAFEVDSAVEFFTRYCRTEVELKASIDFLVQHREQMKDAELSRLEVEAQALLDKFNQVKQHKLLEEIRCFKDVLSLQKQLLRKNGKPRSVG